MRLLQWSATQSILLTHAHYHGPSSPSPFCETKPTEQSQTQAMQAAMISRDPPSSSKNKQGNLSSAADSSGAVTDKPSICRHKDCPLYKAPPCFYRCVEKQLSTPYCVGTHFPDWKQFTGYFQLDQPVGEEGSVRYWAKGHVQKDKHTIQRVMDFADELGHLPLLNQLEKLIEGRHVLN